MGLPWKLLCVVSLVLIGLFHKIDGLQCYQCTEIGTNDLCNEEGTMTCTDPTHDACYTRKHQMDAFGVRYTKSCINMKDCTALERLNHRKICVRTPSNCIYCCQDKDLCNERNMANTIITSMRFLLFSSGVYILVKVII